MDSFLMMMGLLVCYTLLNRLSDGMKFNYLAYCVHRYVRITPLYAAVILVYATLIQHLGSGPFWKTTVLALQKPCQYFWWSALLQIQSYTNPNYLVGNTSLKFQIVIHNLTVNAITVKL